MREKLTVGKVAAFGCAPGVSQDFLWDTEAKGLGVKANAGGSRQYIFESRLHGKTLRITIGDVRTWPLDGAAGNSKTARAEARRLAALIDQGIDPRAEKVERRAKAEALAAAADAREKPALEIWGEYIEVRKANWSAAHLADHLKVVQTGGKARTRGRREGEPAVTQPGALRELLSRPLVEIDADAVKTWLEAQAPVRPTHARLCYGLLRAFLNWCADSKEYRAYAATDACAARVAKERLPKKQAKADCLQREQLPVWFAAVGRLNPIQSAYLQIVLLTGARRNELTGLQWDDVDFRWGSMTIRDKVDGERTIPLTPYVAGVLRSLKTMNETPPPKQRILNGKKIENDLANWAPSKWVFFSRTSKSGHIEEPRIAHDKALKAAGLPALSIHGLRRSFGTLAEWVECPVGIVAQIQGHKPSATAEKHYRVRPLDLLRMWHTKIEAWILSEAGLKQPAETAGGVRKVRSAA